MALAPLHMFTLLVEVCHKAAIIELIIFIALVVFGSKTQEILAALTLLHI